MDSVNPEVPLGQFVRVRQSSTRSVHVEQDLRRPTIAEGYILTAQARRTLGRILERTSGAAPQRAWTLTGPYGSGKSYFGLFLMNLLHRAAPSHVSIVERLQHVDPLLVEMAEAVTNAPQTQGLLPVAVGGYKAPLHVCIRDGIRRSVAQIEDDDVQGILADEALWTDSAPSHAVHEILRRLLKAVTKPSVGYAGMLLLLDEMGKSLEYAAAHPKESDVFLLQEIAELANRSAETPLIFVGILHQSFERYAGHADSLLQREWSKVQGRFEDIAFQEPPVQQMWLLANALEYSDTEAIKQAWPNSETVIDEAIEGGWCPPLINEEEFRKLCRQTLPFHPSAMVALPYLFQRLAQNERSMFAYLTSSEPLGFQEQLTKNVVDGQVRLADLFDYLAANFQGRLYSSLRARPLTETLERLESEPNHSALAVDLLKTIGLLNWLAEVGPFQASIQKLLFALRNNARTDSEIREALDKLTRQSTVIFRRFNQSYAIWQGSDVDIEERLEEARQRQLAAFSIANAVQQYLPPQPVVARRHSYLTGTTRFFEVRYVDNLIREQVSLSTKEGASGLVLLCLSESAGEVEQLTAWAQESRFEERPDLVIAVLQHTPRLTELLREMRSLHWVNDNTPELRDDPVARRELRTRLGELESLIRNELDQTLGLHRSVASKESCWYYLGQEAGKQAQRGLSHLLSEVCDKLYAASPIIRNEILNRRQLSSQGAAARRNLIEGMLERSAQPLLGIEGFPPERSMYESLLRRGGLHRPTDGGELALSAPSADDPLKLRSVWDKLEAYVFALPPQPRSVHELYLELEQPPYGLTEGVLPVLLCAFLSVYRDETTLYSEGSLLPDPSIADWEVMLRRPELYAIAGCRVVGPRRVVVERLARGLQTAPAAMPVVRDLIRRLKSLPEHAWRTQRLSPATLAARRAIEQARSPEHLLFQELPTLFDLPPFAESEEAAGGQVETFFRRLNETLQELNNVMPKLLSEARDQLLAACGLPEGEEGWQQFLTLAGELVTKVHQPPLAPLLRRAGEAPDQQMALESTLAYVANRPPRAWTDGDRDRFVQQVHTMGDLFRRERNGHYTEAGMSAAQRKRSRDLTEKLHHYLHGIDEEDPIVLQAALQALLQTYQHRDDDTL